MDLLIYLAFLVGPLMVGYIIGAGVEKSHYKNIQLWERTFQNMVVVNFRTPPPDWTIESSSLVSGNVVVSLDFFKRFIAGLRGILGGRVTTYETLLDRARREAVIRMKRDARTQGFHTILNLRLETSCVASGGGEKQRNAGVEVHAYGTAVKIRK